MQREVKPKRGNRMNKSRKAKHMKLEPVIAMKMCGPIALGDQRITSKCLDAMKEYKYRYEGKELEDQLRVHLYKDIERLLITRRAQKEREYKKQSDHIQKQLEKVVPR